MKLASYNAKTIASLLAALVPIGLPACGDDEGSDPVGEFDDTVACVHLEDSLDDLNPSAGTDYVALRRAEDYGQPPEEIILTVVSDWGTACEGAGDVAACTDDVANQPLSDALVSLSGFDGNSLYDVLFTDPDGVGTATTRQALLDLLGPVDTADEAVLVAFTDGHNVRCSGPNVRSEGDNHVLLGVSGSGCGEGADKRVFEVTVTPSGEVSLGESKVIEKGDPNCAIGRRPETLRSCGRAVNDLGEFFANVAHLEAAAVAAFAQLARELLAHGAPQSLVRQAVAGVQDEVRHTKATRRLARRFGGHVEPPVVGLDKNRSLFEMALDNAAEGCVRETFGALVASVQAQRAQDPEVRMELAKIAEDETRHAELSWDIDQWVRTRLSDDQVAQLDAAKREAAAKLERDVAYDWPESVVSLAGMPDALASASLANAFRTELALG